MNRFSGQTVLITGGAKGMGRSHAEGFVSEGANVYIADILDDEGRQSATKIGATYVHLDVTDETQWGQCISRIEEETGGNVSVLVNNAAILEDGRLEDEERSADEFRRVLDVNLVGAYLGIRAAAPSMKRAGGGAIVNISSVWGFFSSSRQFGYTASKWGLRGLTKSAAQALGRHNIRVNSVHPGTTATDMHTPDPVRYAKLAIPRAGQPSEVTSMVMFVASDQASYSTGAEFIVDGGFLTIEGP